MRKQKGQRRTIYWKKFLPTIRNCTAFQQFNSTKQSRTILMLPSYHITSRDCARMAFD